MYPVELQLHNWWQHADTTINFTGDVIGLLGPNECGKSAIVSAISYLLTGETTRVKQRNLRWGTTSGFVEGLFDHHGKRIRIRRGISNSACSFSYEGERSSKAITKSGDVDKMLCELMRVTPRIFNGHVIVAQSQLNALVNMQKAELGRDLQFLFRTEKCEKLREVIQARLASFTVTNADLRLENLLQEIPTVEASIAEMSSSMQILEGQARAISVENINALLNDHTVWRDKGPLREQILTRITAITKESNDTSAKRAVDEDKRVELYKTIGDCAASVEQCRTNLRTREARITKSAELEAANVKVTTARGNLDACVKNKVVRQVFDTSAPQAVVDSLGPTHTVALQSLRRLQTLGATCPTCQQAISNHAELMAKFSAEVEDLAPKIAAAEEQISTLKKADRENEMATANYNTTVLHLEYQLQVSVDQRDRLIAELAYLGSMDIDVAAVTEFIAKFESCERDARALDTTVAVSKQTLESLQQQLVQNQNLLADIVLPHRRPSDVEAQAAAEGLQRYKAISDQMISATASLRERQARLEALQREKNSLEHEALLAGRKKDFCHTLTEIRNLLHRDELPRKISKAYLQRTNVMFSHILTQLQFSHTAVLNEDHVFECHSPDGHVLFASELSGGAGMLFCLAFRLAVNLQFANHVGLLILDEPTAYVDSDNVKHVVDVFVRLQSFVRSMGIKVIVVTHEEALLPAFDQIIHVPTLMKR